MASDTEQTGIHRGTFFDWFESGLEGMVWALKPTDDDSSKGLVILEKLDWVEIRDKNGAIVFSGEINPDYDVGRTPPDSPRGRNRLQRWGVGFTGLKQNFPPMSGPGFLFRGMYTQAT